MTSDREKMQLVRDVRDGTLPEVDTVKVTPFKPAKAEVSSKTLDSYSFSYNGKGYLETALVKGVLHTFIYDAAGNLVEVRRRSV